MYRLFLQNVCKCFPCTTIAGLCASEVVGSQDTSMSVPAQLGKEGVDVSRINILRIYMKICLMYFMI
jgi:hypothetical protein